MYKVNNSIVKYDSTSLLSNRILFALTFVILSSLLLISMSILSLQQASATLSSTNSTDSTQVKQVVQQGIVTSSTDPLPGHESHQSAVILRLRNDNAVYTGTLTFTATKPVEVQVLHRSLNSTIPAIDEEFGTMSILPLGGSGTVTISNIIPTYPEGSTSFVASIPFSGNAISLHNIDGEPFSGSFTVAGQIVGPAIRVDAIDPITPATDEVNSEYDDDNDSGSSGDDEDEE